MEPPLSRTERTELRILTADVSDALSMTGAIRGDGVLSLVVSPILALVIEEASRYLTSRDPRLTLPSSFAEERTKARARLKQFDDRRGGFEHVADFMRTAQSESAVWFSEHHRGLRGAIARLLQPDLGAYFVGEDIVTTTHVAMASMGLTADKLQSFGPRAIQGLLRFAYEFGEENGQCLVRLAQACERLGAQVDTRTPQHRLELAVSSDDFMARRFYGSISKKSRLYEATPAATLVLSQVNAARLVVPALLPPSSNVAFRIRFLVAYHASSSVRAFSPSFEFMRHAGTHPDGAELLRLRSARNLLAHYELQLGPDTRVTDLRAAVAHAAGRSFEDVEALVDAQLCRIGDALGESIARSKLRRVRAFLGDSHD